jgi:hypothetical protein
MTKEKEQMLALPKAEAHDFVFDLSHLARSPLEIAFLNLLRILRASIEAADDCVLWIDLTIVSSTQTSDRTGHQELSSG